MAQEEFIAENGQAGAGRFFLVGLPVAGVKRAFCKWLSVIYLPFYLRVFPANRMVKCWQPMLCDNMAK